MAEHGARYARLGAAAADRGIAVWAPDLRGHGQSVADACPLGHLGDRAGWARTVADQLELARHVADQESGRPLILFGHSMGSLLAQDVLTEVAAPFAGAALSAASGPPPPKAQLGRLIARFERLRRGGRHPSPLLQAMSFGEFNKKISDPRTAFDWLSRDPAQIDAYVADPLCGFACSTGTWVELLDALPRLAHPTRLGRLPKDLALYLFCGGGDPVAGFGRGPERLARAWRAAGLTRVETKVYPEARHETLNETNRDQVVRDLLDWCDRVIAGQEDSLTSRR